MAAFTVKVDGEVLKKFKKLARLEYGPGEENFDKAVSEALENWTKSKKKTSAFEDFLKIANKGYKLGGLSGLSRDELHKR